MDEPKEPIMTDPASAVWPPPPLGSPAGAAPLPLAFRFAPLGRLARAIVILLTLYMALCAVTIGNALSPSTSRTLGEGVDGLRALLLLTTGVCFLVWTYRLDTNLRAFGVAGLTVTPGWAAGYFFIPIVNLYKPYQIFSEIWQASDPGPAPREGRAWQTLKAPALVGFWWAFWLASGVAERLTQTSHEAGAAALCAALRLLGAGLAFLLVRQFTIRQEATARQLSLLA